MEEEKHDHIWHYKRWCATEELLKDKSLSKKQVEELNKARKESLIELKKDYDRLVEEWIGETLGNRFLPPERVKELDNQKSLTSKKY